MEQVNVKVHDGVATIVMDRPQKKNSLSPSLIEDLMLAFSDVHQEKRARGVVLMGAGTDFCSGVDLETFGAIAELPPSEALTQWFEHWRRLTDLLEAMLRFPKPIVAAVDGIAMGAGLGLVLASDLVVASQDAKFSADAIRRGLVGGSTIALLHFRLGGAIASRMSLLGDALTAQEYHRSGGCGEPVTSDQLWVAATDLVRRCARGSAEAIQATKRVLNEGIGEQLLTQLAAGAAGSATVCTTEAATEGIRAFIEKRDPKWPT